jgi:hypothetical protein
MASAEAEDVKVYKIPDGAGPSALKSNSICPIYVYLSVLTFTII